MMQLAARAQRQRQLELDEASPGHSPQKGVLAAKPPHVQPATTQKPPPHLDKLKVLPPRSIEEVPFRRQDRRILNSRKKRIMDRKLIRCIVITAVVGVLLGAAMITLGLLFDHVEEKLDAMVLAGGVLVFLSVMLLFFSIEIRIRLNQNVRRVQDPEIDTVKNLHHIKHWMPPELIPYGWGHDKDMDDRYDGGGDDDDLDDEAMIVPVKHKEKPFYTKRDFQKFHDRAEMASSRGGAGVIVLQMQDNAVYPDPTTKVTESSSNKDHDDVINSMMLQVEREENFSEIGSDIFDESLRFSHVDRPSFHINRSSPVARKTGDFITEEERIANIFSPKNTP